MTGVQTCALPISAPVKRSCCSSRSSARPSPNDISAPDWTARLIRPIAPAAAAGAIGRIKRAVQSGAEMSFGDGLALERELQQLLFTGADAGEGLAAYLEKRAPRFTGR